MGASRKGSGVIWGAGPEPVSLYKYKCGGGVGKSESENRSLTLLWEEKRIGKERTIYG